MTKNYRKVIVSSISLFAAGGIAYIFFGFSSAEERIKEVCSQIKPGMAIAQLSAFGVVHGLAPQPRNESGVNYMVERKSYGRYGCKVVLEAGLVKTVEYHFAD